jgi:uncharacterized protein YndB with AHSA1/START domain
MAGPIAGREEVAAISDRVEKSTELAAPVERVWHADRPRRVRPVVQGRARRAVRAGEVSRGRIAYSGYEHLPWEATVVAMERPRLFSFTWHPYAVDPGVDYAGEPTTPVEFRLVPTPGGTRLTVVESGFDAAPAHRRAEALRMNEGGWEEQVRNTKAHVEG